MKQPSAYEVSVWFATSYGPRVVARLDNLDEAMREARSYLSDSRSITVQSPAGDVIVVKSSIGEF